MPMRRTSDAAIRLAAAKNAVRGAIGNQRQSIVNTIAANFGEIATESAAEFFNWLSGYPAKLYDLFPDSKLASYSNLTLELAGDWRHLPAILRWSSEFLRQNSATVHRYVELSNEFELAWLVNDIAKAEDLLSLIEKELGTSVWLIQTQIGFLQRCRGLEAQKQYARGIQEAAPKSLAGSISHYVSQRNESTVSLIRFRQRVERLLGSPKIPIPVRDFMLVQLSGKSLTQFSPTTLAGYLGVCAGLSVIDTYNGLIESLQTICLWPDFGNMKELISSCLSILPNSDVRIKKISAVCNDDFRDLQSRSWSAEDWYVSGDGACAAISLLEMYMANRADIDALIWCGAAYAMAAESPSPTDLPSLPLDYLRWVTAARLKDSDVSASITDATKSLLNLRGLHSSRAVLGYILGEMFEFPVYGISPATEQFWATPYLHPAHSIHLPATVAHSVLAECQSREPRNRMVTMYQAALFGRPSEFAAHDDVILETASISALWKNDPQAALIPAEKLAKSRIGAFRRRAAQIEIHCLLREGDADNAIRRTAHHCCEEDGLRSVLPLSDIIPTDRWKDIKHLRGDIALPIAVDLAMRTIADTKYVTLRRIAYDEFLLAHHCDRPSYFAHQILQFPLKQTIYFLDRICVSDVMDVSFRTFKNSRDLQNERINVCALLSQIDPKNSGSYSEEIKQITRIINLQEGLRDVDKSRVHINTDAIQRWAESELRESFQRYKILAKLNASYAPQSDLEKAMREAIEGDRHALESYLQYPTHEGDSLLLEIFEAIKYEYLLNPDYGLDAYLSMRIRHGSLAGHLRGPLEEKTLLLPTEKAAATKAVRPPSDESVRQLVTSGIGLGALPLNDLHSLYAAWSEFSQAYEGVIDDLAKNKLQVRRSEKPEGLFTMESLPLYVYWVRSRVNAETTFADFFADIATAIEVLLTKCLVEVRRHITENVKAKVEAIFDKFRKSIERTSNSELYYELHSLIASAIPEVQAAIDRVADWFAYDQAQEIAALRSADQIVDIAIEATKNARRGFNPKIDRDIEDLGLQSQGVLLEFTDILFTILDNVYRHSEVGDEPWVKIRVSGDMLTDMIHKRVTIRVDSEIDPNARTANAIAKLERIRSVMGTEEYRKQVNLEGGTGLLKLRRLIARDHRQTLAFGFEDDHFFVEVNLVFVLLSTV